MPYTKILKCWLFILILGLAFNTTAQKVEFGGGGGPTFYKGDLQPKFNPLNPALGGNVFLRYNFNRIVSAKFNAGYGVVKGNDSRSGDPFQKARDFAFSHQLIDSYIQAEYNFLNFRTHTGRYEYDWTPYFFGGLGYAYTMGSKFSVKDQIITSGDSFGGIIIPFGVGIKQILTPRLNLTAEFNTKVFFNNNKGAAFDGLNGLNGDNIYIFGLDNSHPNYDQHILPNTNQKDKYYQITVTLSYLIYGVKCNTPGQRTSFF